MEILSIIIPVYNVEPYLYTCVNSLLRQTYTNLEIILIDDGSTDGSVRLTDALAERDSRIRVVHQRNQGLGAARNTGIALAKGQWLLFVDSDDYVSETYAEDLYWLVEKYNADVAVTGYRRFLGSGFSDRDDAHIPSSDGHTSIVFTPEEAICDMWYQKNIPNFAWGKIFRKEIFTEYKFPTDVLYEDLACMYLLFAEAGRIAYAPVPDYYYRIHDGSIMNEAYNARKMDRVKVSRKLLEWAGGQSAALRKAAEERFFLSNVQVLREIPYQKKYAEEIAVLGSNIKQYRRSVLTNPEVKAGNRTIAAASYLGIHTLKLLGNCYTRTRELRLRHMK